MYEEYQSLMDQGLKEIKRLDTQPENLCDDNEYSYTKYVLEDSQKNIICIVNQKGGCGKTTTAINLSSCLASEGYQVLLIDTDPQAQASIGLGIDVEGPHHNLYDVLVNGVNIESAIQQTNIEGLDIIAANSLLSGAHLDLSSFSQREYILKFALRSYLMSSQYDYVVIDCSPTLNLITMNALAASNNVLIPIQMHYFSLQGMKELMITIDRVKENLNGELRILGILVTLFDKRIKISQQLLDQIRAYFNELVFSTYIRINVKLCEAPMFQKSIEEYADDSRGAADYRDLTKEVIARTSPKLVETIV